MSQLQLGAELMGQLRYADALKCFRSAQALRGFADERMTMRTRLMTSSIMDTAAFARELESIYRRLAAWPLCGRVGTLPVELLDQGE